MKAEITDKSAVVLMREESLSPKNYYRNHFFTSQSNALYFIQKYVTLQE